MRHFLFCLMLAAAAGTVVLTAQAPPAPQQPPPAQTPPAAPPAAPAPPAPQTQPAVAPPLSDTTPFELNDASLTDIIRILAQRLKINYILDPAVKGSVTIYTYGQIRALARNHPAH
jgi:general secretion pathway protein D